MLHSYLIPHISFKEVNKNFINKIKEKCIQKILSLFIFDTNNSAIIIWQYVLILYMRNKEKNICQMNIYLTEIIFN